MKKILVADDDPALRKVLVEKFNKSGWEAVGAADGEETLAHIKETRFDIILLDLRMPKKTGFEVLEAVKADSNLAHPVVLVLSASGEDDDIKRALALGATDYFVKVDDSLEKILKWASIYTGVTGDEPAPEAAH